MLSCSLHSKNRQFLMSSVYFKALLHKMKFIVVLGGFFIWSGIGSVSTEVLGPHPQSQRQRKTSSFCPEGHFECEINPSLCVPQSSICNGKFDCGPNDQSDEVNCHNIHEKDIWDTFYQKRPDADLDKNAICKYDSTDSVVTLWKSKPSAPGDEEISHRSNDSTSATNHKMTFRENRPDCHCVGEKLFCQNLSHRPNLLLMIPQAVEFLDLSGSPVDIRDLKARNFSHMHTLILSSCSIQDIPPGIIGSLASLETLHLTSNRIRAIPNDAFAGNGNLLKLFLGYNGLSKLSPGSFHGLPALQGLDLRHNDLTGTEAHVFAHLKSLRVLQLSNNKIETLRATFLFGLDDLEILNLGHNTMASIESDTFEHMVLLRQLYLSWNRFKTIDDNIFCNLHSLLNLNLNGNEISHIQRDAFACLENLESLNLERNRFGELDHPRLIFGNLTKLHHIYFDQFWMCWWAPQVRDCQPKGDGISSQENLLDNLVLRICVWIMGLLGVVGNVFVIGSRMIFREKNRIHSFYIKNLALADLLMGVSLLSIAFHDVKFRGEFLAHQHSWRHSWTCQMSGVLSTLSSESSVLILTLITLDRYISIVRPFAERTSSLRPAIGIITLLWLISFSLSYLPLTHLLATHYFGFEFYSSNGLCLPLQIHNPFDPGWQYSFFLFVILNSLAFSFISYAYWTMLRIIQDSSTTLRSNQQNQDGVLAMRFGLVVVTDFICWAPVIAAKIIAMAGIQIPGTVYGWLLIFVLPINSNLNCLIYSLSTRLYQQQMGKLTSGFRKRFRRANMDDSTVSTSFFSRTLRRTTTTSMGNSISMSYSKRASRNEMRGRRATKSNITVNTGPTSSRGNGGIPNAADAIPLTASAVNTVSAGVAQVHPANGSVTTSLIQNE